MIFGLAITPEWMIGLGVILLVLTVTQILIGLRKIKLGRKTFVYHRYIAFAILGIGAVHGISGVVLLMGWRLF
jgi:hypothetical protein